MKTCLTTPCFLMGDDKLGNGTRFERNVKYINYYTKLKDNIGFDRIVLLDNMSPMEMLEQLGCNIYDADTLALVKKTDSIVDVYRFNKFLDLHPKVYYPYCWRALYYCDTLINKLGYEKLISIDSDCYLLTKKAVDYTRNCNSGWVSVWCQKYNWSETSYSILNKDAFSNYRAFTGKCGMFEHEGCMENLFPFTHINKELLCSRWGEDRIPQEKSMDIYSQCPVDFPMTYNMEGK